jgi:hypothetical protein
MNRSKSPLKDAPLRNPGQSLDARIDDLGLDMFQPFLVATMLVVLALLEWFRWYRDSPPHPVFYSLVAVAGIIYAIIQTRRNLARLRALKLGRDGEKAVGQYLEQVREADARVFHDLVGDGFNLDHVLVSTKGVFAIETKTWSKPIRGEANITYDGEHLFANGQKRDRDPVKQALAQARWLSDLIRESTGKAFPIRPVVVFPGWYVNSTATTAAKSKGVWLLNPKALPDFIGAERASMAAEDVRLVSYHLGRSIRTRH